MDVRRLAVIDMYGSKGVPRRAQIILVEFVAGALLLITLGCWVATRASGAAGWLLAFWMIGMGVNYVPLAAHAIALRRPERLSAELSGVDTSREIRRYGLLQLWILVPLALVIFSLDDQWQRRSGRS